MGNRPPLQGHGTDIDLAEFMSEFAHHLIAAGITSAQFVEIARVAYFRAASTDAKFLNNRTNQSAVAAMTGLTRVQVRAFAKADRTHGKSKLSRIQNIIRGWNTDAAFTTAQSLPRRLSIGSKKAAFGELVKKYGGDVPARSILREMTRVGFVTVRGQFVYLNKRARRTRGEAKLQHLSQVLTHLIREPGSTSSRSYPLSSMIREVIYPSASSKGQAILRKKSADELRVFVSELEAAGHAASVETPPRGNRATLVTRSRVLVLTEDLGPNESK
jgi:hypothetical protein